MVQTFSVVRIPTDHFLKTFSNRYFLYSLFAFTKLLKVTSEWSILKNSIIFIRN
jgi:hypothetical protein